MARFYVGQPVVCLWERRRWLVGVLIEDLGAALPEKGARYTVSGYGPPLRGFEYVTIAELPSHHRGEPVSYQEDGFAPITEDRVRAIVEEAHRAPTAREFEKLED